MIALTSCSGVMNKYFIYVKTKKLTVEDQDAYFENIISTLFDQEQPKQILFSFLKDNKFIGYGGLVHINWIDKNAEISFLMNTEEEKN